MMDAAVGFAGEFWGMLGQMAPYLLFGFFVAGALSVFVSPELVERHLGSGGLWPVVKAALFGVPLPLCSCGVIPVSASLRRHGASRGATTAFLISTPQTGVDSIFVTLSLLGPVFAVFRPVVALVGGVFGGLAAGAIGGDGREEETSAPACTAACCQFDRAHGRLRRMLHYGFVTLPEDIGKSLLVGLLIAALISVALPPDFLAGKLGQGMTGMVVMMLCGIPMYVCATASVPVAAAIMLKGASPGAALVFLMTGPATNAAALTTIWRIMGGRTAIAYLGSVAVAALASGLLLDWLFRFESLPEPGGMGKMLPAYVGHVAAVVLILVVGNGMFKRREVREEETVHPVDEGAEDEAEETVTLEVGGMTCNHCVNSVKRALAECAGVDWVSVELAGGKGVVRGRGMSVDCLREAVAGLGYEVTAAGAENK